MLSLLDILDSAVKIGLGALITGLATYHVTKRNHAHELRKLRHDDSRQLYREIALHAEASFQLLRSFVHSFAEGGDGRPTRVDELSDSVAKLSHARALSMLSGRLELMEELMKLQASLSDLQEYFLIHLNDADQDQSAIEALLQSVEDGLPRVQGQLAGAYQSIYAGEA